MGIVSKTMQFLVGKGEKEKTPKENLLQHLKLLKELESKLWGITLVQVSQNEEKLMEDANHLIQVFSKNNIEDLQKIYKFKEVKEFTIEVTKLREDFIYLRKQIKEGEKLKNLITQYTIKLVNERNFSKLEKIFLLEKQLYEVIELQEKEFNELFSTFSKIKNISDETKIEVFMDSLKKTRTILAGHMDFHALWEEERKGFSNSSNIVHSLIKIITEEKEL